MGVPHRHAQPRPQPAYDPMTVQQPQLHLGHRIPQADSATLSSPLLHTPPPPLSPQPHMHTHTHARAPVRAHAQAPRAVGGEPASQPLRAPLFSDPSASAPLIWHCRRPSPLALCPSPSTSTDCHPHQKGLLHQADGFVLFMAGSPGLQRLPAHSRRSINSLSE